MKLTWPSRKFLLIIGGLGATVLVGSWLLGGGSAEATYVTAPVEERAIAKTVEVSGDLHSVTDLELSFGAGGRVASLNNRVGERVAAGQVIASLEAGEQTAAVVAAREALRQAQAELGLKNAGATVEDIALKQAVVTAAVTGLQGAETDLVAKERLTAVQLQGAELALSQAEAAQLEQTAQVAKQVATAARSVIVDVRQALATADQVLGRENQLINLEFRDYLGIYEPQKLQAANSAFDRAAEARDAADALVLSLHSTVTPVDVAALEVKLELALVETASTLTYTAQLLDVTVVDTRGFGPAEIVALKSAVSGARSSLAGAESAWQKTLQSYESTRRLQAQAVESAKLTLLTERAQVNATLAAANSAVAARQAELEQAEADLDRLLAAPRSLEVQALESVVRARQAEVRAAESCLARVQIVAPVNGRLAKLDLQVGEEATIGTPVVLLVAETDAYEIIVNLSESDVSDITAGLKATVTFDAFGTDQTWQATVLSVSPASKSIEGVVYYEAKVLLNANQELKDLKPGLSADVTIIVAEVNKAIVVPQRAVLTNADNQKYVRVMTGEATYTEQLVEVGLKADDGQTQILSGLTVGSKVLLNIKD